MRLTQFKQETSSLRHANWFCAIHGFCFRDIQSTKVSWATLNTEDSGCKLLIEYKINTLSSLNNFNKIRRAKIVQYEKKNMNIYSFEEIPTFSLLELGDNLQKFNTVKTNFLL